MVSFITNSYENNKVHNGLTGTHASQLRQRRTLPQASAHSMTSKLWRRLAQSFTFALLENCQHASTKTTNGTFIFTSTENFRSCSFHYSINLFEKSLKKKPASDWLLLFHRNTFTNPIIGKDALNFETNRTSFLFISFSRLIYRYKYRDIEKEQWKAQQKQIQAKWFNFLSRKTIVYCLHGKTKIKHGIK